MDEIVKALSSLKSKVESIETGLAKMDSRLSNVEHNTWDEGAGMITAKAKQTCHNVNPFSGSTWDHVADHVTAVVGLREALTSRHRIKRIVWQFLCVLGICATIATLFMTTMEFLQDPTATSVCAMLMTSQEGTISILLSDAPSNQQRLRIATHAGLSERLVRYGKG